MKPCSNIQIGLEMKIKELECTERQTDRQTDRQADRQTDRQRTFI